MTHTDILVINTGSSSLKYAVFAPGPDGPQRRAAGQVGGIGTPNGDAPDHHAALSAVVARVRTSHPDWAPAAVGHRVVHGGARFTAPARIDAAVRAALAELAPLAPLHLPANVLGIEAATKAFPGAVQVACF